MKHKPTFQEIVAILAGIAVLIALTLPELVAEERQRLTEDCKNNLRVVAIAIEMYAVDSAGEFPTDLQSLTPRYLKAIPTCPAANLPTYSLGREPDTESQLLACWGRHHSELPKEDYPRFTFGGNERPDSRGGLVPH